jgi:hypothetical protein
MARARGTGAPKARFAGFSSSRIDMRGVVESLLLLLSLSKELSSSFTEAETGRSIKTGKLDRQLNFEGKREWGQFIWILRLAQQIRRIVAKFGILLALV